MTTQHQDKVGHIPCSEFHLKSRKVDVSMFLQLLDPPQGQRDHLCPQRGFTFTTPAAQPTGTSGNEGKSTPLLDSPVMKQMSSSVGMYHQLGPTQKAYRWAFHRRIRCCKNKPWPFREVASSQNLRRPTFLRSPWVAVIIGYASISLSRAFHRQTMLYWSACCCFCSHSSLLSRL